MKKIIALTFILASLLIGCDGIDRDQRLSDLEDGKELHTTGYFRGTIALPIPKDKPTKKYIQDGVGYSNLKSVSNGRPYCTIVVREMYIEDYGPSCDNPDDYILLSNTYRQTKVWLKKNGKKFDAQFEFRFIEWIRHNRFMYSANVKAEIQCTEGLSLGQMLEIFKFEYNWIPPSM